MCWDTGRKLRCSSGGGDLRGQPTKLETRKCSNIFPVVAEGNVTDLEERRLMTRFSALQEILMKVAREKEGDTCASFSSLDKIVRPLLKHCDVVKVLGPMMNKMAAGCNGPKGIGKSCSDVKHVGPTLSLLAGGNAAMGNVSLLAECGHVTGAPNGKRGVRGKKGVIPKKKRDEFPL
jgi:hypothetical protein